MRLLQNCKVKCFIIYKRMLSRTTRIVMTESLPAAAYKPEVVEVNEYDKWERDGYFKPEVPSKKPTFSMVLPPPNVTGKLHLGHALACTIQDVIARRNRSLGYNVLWLPGIDHAGIATQGVVEKYLKSKQNITRNDIGRERFVKEVWNWKDKYGSSICEQLRTLGCSLDWSRQVFTMDPHHVNAVNTAFIRLFQNNLIYRKKALVNWCSVLKSTVSDIEVENVPINEPTEVNLPGYDRPVKFGLLYNFAYKIFDSDEEIVVSTTMPETMLGDTAIAVHPDDVRYMRFKGKHAVHPFRNKAIPIILDDFVDMQFGTGAVKITPAHSKVDYDIGKHHNLPLIQVIDEEGCMVNVDTFNKLKRYDCRNMLVQKLAALGLLRQTIPHKMVLPVCSRSGNVIDHLPKEQWFLSCSKLNERAEAHVKNNDLKIEPEKFVKNWFDWTGDDRDWCISRQLWWGHQIPAYKCSADKDIIWVAATDVESAKTQASKYLRTLPELINVERDTDVLDTWFSSGIYPFAALGWPDYKSRSDFKHGYPLSLMATGHDILGFWVHRMVILGLELTGTLPFKNVLLHGIICDSKGAKMSKSKGNVINPIDVINGISMKGLHDKSEEMYNNGILTKDELDKALAYHRSNFSNTQGIPECGVDALRFTLLSQDIKSHFVNFDVALCHANKLFCNKIWQSIKYMQLSFAKLKIIEDQITHEHLTYFDKWILSRLAFMVETVNNAMDSYDFHTATKALRSLIYNDFCDTYLEATKVGFESENYTIGYGHAHTLSAVLNTSLRCLAPFMIYLTHELIPKVPAFETNIIYNYRDEGKKHFEYPKTKDFEGWKDKEFETQVSKVLAAVNLVRELKGLYNIANRMKPMVRIKTSNGVLITDIKDNKNAIVMLMRCGDITFDLDNRNYVSGILDNDTEIGVELLGDGVEDAVLAAKNKLQKRIKKLEDSLAKMELKYSSSSYLMSAPEWTQVLDKEKILTKKRELKELQRLI